jgi:formate hydrogenlyase subunit 6/NADH:ubiquinone oxidoreductase subunit I
MDTIVQEGRRRRWLRRVSRLGTLAVAAVLLLPILPWAWPSMIVAASSPYVTVTSTIAVRSVSAAMLIGLPISLIVLVRRRWFCRWVCPVGLGVECAGLVSPMPVSRSRGVPPISKGLVALAAGGALVGYPLLLCLDPMAMLCGVFNLAGAPDPAAGWVSAAVLGGVLVLTIVLPGAWCFRLCPLGAFQDLAYAPYRLLIRGGRKVAPPPGADADAASGLPRRSLIGMGMGALGAGVGVYLGLTARTKGKGRTPSVLRPPGSVDDWKLHQLCIRCGNCARACPAGIIRPDWLPETVAGWLTPVVRIEGDYCREHCGACMQVCPSGAIPRRPPAAKTEAPIGRARVDIDRCLLALDRECPAMCLTACPYDAIRMHEWTWEDDRRFPVIEAGKCPGCGACVIACRPMEAITVLRSTCPEV